MSTALLEEKTTKDGSPYKRPIVQPFYEKDIDKTTILLGGLSYAGDQFLVSGIISLGFRAEALPQPDSESMELGKEFCDAGLCNPTYYTVGNLIKYLDQVRMAGDTPKTHQEIVDQYVYVTAGSRGPCRFGMYEYQYQNALEKAGYKGFRILLFQAGGGLSQKGEAAALKFNVEFFRVVLNGIMLSDNLNAMRYKLAPFEANRGDVEKTFMQCVDIINRHLRAKPTLEQRYRGRLARFLLRSQTGQYLVNIYDQYRMDPARAALAECREEIQKLQLNYMRPKPVVKITGEFWAQLTEGDGNFKIFSYLLDEGCEIAVEPVTSWIVYMLYVAQLYNKERFATDEDGWVSRLDVQKYRQKKKILRLKLFGLRFAGWYYLKNYYRYSKWMGGFARKEPSVHSIATDSKKYISLLFQGGEGFLEVAKNIYYTKNKLAHMVLSVKPFGCMPSTISDSVQARVVGDFDDMVFLPIETAGEGKINAISRVQMALGEARENMNRELDAVLAKHGYSRDDWELLEKKYGKNISAMEKISRVKGYAMGFSHYLHWAKKNLK